MTTSTVTMQSTSFIDQAQELYQSDPLAAAIKLTDGVKSILKYHGLQLEPAKVRPNGHLMFPGQYPYPTIPEQNLDLARRSLARTRKDARAGIAPEPDEWQMDIEIARSAVHLTETIHG